jgi:P2-related tail formation protein
MSSVDTILPDSVSIFKNIEAFDLAAKQWIDQLKIEAVLVYLIDQVDPAALIVLAEQFDVLGYKGWKLATTDADRRALIKRAIELHKYKGTIWGVVEAMKSIGFTDAIILEHISGHWANFKVQLFNQSAPITPTSIAELRLMIEEYKNTRSNLVDIFIQIDAVDVFETEDEIGAAEEVAVLDFLYLSAKLFYDGSGNYDGSFDHSGDSDVITAT